MIRYYFKTIRDEFFQEIESAKENAWIHIDDALPEDIEFLSKMLQLDHTDLQDCLDKYELPRLEKLGNTLLIFTRYASEQEKGLYTSTLTIILTPHYTITISPSRPDFLYRFLQTKNRISTMQRPKLLIVLLSQINQEFTKLVRKMRHAVLFQEKEMSSINSDDIIDLTKNEEVLNQYLSALTPLYSVLESVLSGKQATFHQKDQDLLLDLLNAVKQSEEICSNSVRSIRNLRDSYQIIFTNNVARTIKLLTALTILFGIPTTIASFYGMNIVLPFANREDAFFIIIAATTLIVMVSALLFHRKQWL